MKAVQFSLILFVDVLDFFYGCRFQNREKNFVFLNHLSYVDFTERFSIGFRLNNITVVIFCENDYGLLVKIAPFNSGDFLPSIIIVICFRPHIRRVILVFVFPECVET